MPYKIIKDKRRSRLKKFAVQNAITKRTHGWTSLPKAKRQKGLLTRITGGSTPNGQVPNLNTPPNRAPGRSGPPVPARRVSLEGNNVQRMVGVLAASPGSSPIRARSLEFGDVGPDSPPRTPARVPYHARQAAIEATRQREAAQAAARARRRAAEERYFAQHGRNRDPRDQHSGSEEGFGKYGAHHLRLAHHLKGGVGEPDALIARINRMRFYYQQLMDPETTGWIINAVALPNAEGVVAANLEMIDENMDDDIFYDLLDHAERLQENINRFWNELPHDIQYEATMNWIPRLAVMLPRLHFLFNLHMGSEQGSDFESDFASTYHSGDPSEAGHDSQASMLDDEMDPSANEMDPAGNESDVTVPIGGSRMGGARDPNAPGAPPRPPRLPEPNWREVAQAREEERARQVAQEAARGHHVPSRSMPPYNKHNTMSGGAKRRLLDANQYRTYAHVLYEHRKLMSEIRPILASIFPSWPFLHTINPVMQLAAIENSSFDWGNRLVEDINRIADNSELFAPDELNDLVFQTRLASDALSAITDEEGIRLSHEATRDHGLSLRPVGPGNEKITENPHFV